MSSESREEKTNRHNSSTGGALTYLALGDSYTIGESIPEEERWSFQLIEILRGRGINVGGPDIIAQTGWTTSELINAIKKQNNHNTYSLVSLLIGVNNQYRGESIASYRLQFQELLHISIGYANGRKERVFVFSIPDWSVTPFAKDHENEKISLEIDAFNRTAEEECKREGVLFIDVTSSSRLAKGEEKYLASDGLHFSGAMYKLWAETAAPLIIKNLE